jgi:hypothetical protein
VCMTEAETEAAAADGPSAVSSPMREELLKILKTGDYPGISNRLSSEVKWLPEDDELRTSDREFLQRWLTDYADDPAWDKLITAANRFKKSGTFRHLSLIWYALRARRLAEDAGSGIDPLYVERRKTRKELLDLAKSADALARYWHRAQAKSAVLAPWFPPFPVPFEQVLQFQEFNAAQAECLRRIAGRPPRPTRISRQGRSAKRKQTREFGVFMRTIVGFMREICGRPQLDVVAMLANVGFPEADFTTDDVRTATQPTTRSARRQKTMHSTRKTLTECIAEIPPPRVKIPSFAPHGCDARERWRCHDRNSRHGRAPAPLRTDEGRLRTGPRGSGDARLH